MVLKKSADLLSKRQIHEEDFFQIMCVLLKKSELYIRNEYQVPST